MLMIYKQPFYFSCFIYMYNLYKLQYYLVFFFFLYHISKSSSEQNFIKSHVLFGNYSLNENFHSRWCLD